MATQEWLEAARNYSLISESARAEYWQQLTPEQQEALREALDASQVATTTPSVTSETGTKRGCGGPVGAGCLGMILGCILTIGIEIAIISAGIDAVGEMLSGLSGSPGPSQAREEPATAKESERVKSADCRDPQYRREHPFVCGSERSCIEDCRKRYPE